MFILQWESGLGLSVVPILLSVIWKKTNKVGAIAGCLVGLVSGAFSLDNVRVNFVWRSGLFHPLAKTSHYCSEISRPSRWASELTICYLSVIRPNYFNFEVK